MVRKIKFPLLMGDGIEVRTIEDLKLHFDLENVIEYFLNGKLKTWLEQRNYTNEISLVDELDKCEDKKQIPNKLCKIFDIEYKDNIDILKIENKKKRENLLKQYTDDERWMEKIDYIAFNQEELESNLLNWNFNKTTSEKETYICGNDFVITDKINNITYVGVNKCTAVLHSNKNFDANNKNIKFVNLTLTSNTTLDVFWEKNKNCSIDNNKIKIKKLWDNKPTTFDVADINYEINHPMMLYKSKIIIARKKSVIEIIDTNTKEVWNCYEYLKENVPLDNSRNSMELHEAHKNMSMYRSLKLFSVNSMNIIDNILICICESSNSYNKSMIRPIPI